MDGYSTSKLELMRAEIKKFCSSKLARVILISYICSAVLSVIIMFLTAKTIPVTNDLELVFGTDGAKFYYTFLWCMVPLSALIVGYFSVAYTCMYRQGLKDETKPFNTIGFSMLRVYSIIGMVGTGLLIVLMAVACVAAIVLSCVSSDIMFSEADAVAITAGVTVIGALLFVLYGLLGGFAIIYGVKSCKVLGSIIKTFKTDEAVAKGSNFLGVCAIISGGFSAFYSVTYFINFLISLFQPPFNSIFLANSFTVLLQGVAMVFSAVHAISFGILMLKFKKTMKQIGG